jgi:hypothetical protein
MTLYQLSLDLEIPANALSAAPANPFLDAQVRTFADMIECVRQDPSLKASRRYSLTSALRGFAKLMHQEPAAMPAMVSAYSRQVKRLTPAGCGLSAKRIGNIKSDVLFCLRRYGTLRRRTAMPAIGPAWTPLWGRLDVYQGWALSRFVRWCSGSGRIPTGITNSDIERFHADLRESFADNPNRLTQSVCRTWNKLSETAPDLGLAPLIVPRYHKPYTVCRKPDSKRAFSKNSMPSVVAWPLTISSTTMRHHVRCGPRQSDSAGFTFASLHRGWFIRACQPTLSRASLLWLTRTIYRPR